MKNSPQHVEEVSAVVEDVMVTGNVAAVVAATKVIDDAFFLVQKNLLPSITFGSLDDAFTGKPYAQTNNLTEDVFNGDFKKMRDLGLQFLVMADYVEQRVVKEQVDTAKARRFKVFKELFPENVCTLDEFLWDTLHEFEQMVIDKMVLMKMEIDKNF